MIFLTASPLTKIEVDTWKETKRNHKVTIFQTKIHSEIGDSINRKGIRSKKLRVKKEYLKVEVRRMKFLSCSKQKKELLIW